MALSLEAKFLVSTKNRVKVRLKLEGFDVCVVHTNKYFLSKYLNVSM
ncbi:MAG: hypothetical protein Q4P17_10220 [Methanobacterium sp.]|nr:hypothetical protein [Methanobacterium sp.]